MNILLKHLFIVFLILISFISYSQNSQLAQEHFNNKQYDLALKFFKKAWKKNKTDIEINYLYANCILKSNSDRSSAINLLEYVIGVDINYKNANLFLAKAYTYKHEYNKSKQVLDFFIKNYKDNDTLIIAEALILSKQISTAKELIKDPLNVSFVNLGRMVNTKRSEFNPFIANDGMTLYYTSNKKYDVDLEELIMNIYLSKYSINGYWGKMKSIGKNINSSENEVIVGLSKNENKIITHVTFMDMPGDILISEKVKRRYGELSELEKSINSSKNEASASLSSNEDTLFFCSNREGGYGGQDIYISVKLPNNTWGKPQNLGAQINTKYNETYPNINEKGNILQFASDRPESMGGYDIFTINKMGNTWGNIKNIGYPLNNNYDNFVITYSKSRRYAYTAQIREGGMGGLDIYQVIFKQIPSPIVIYSGTIKQRIQNKSEIIRTDITIELINSNTNKIIANSNYSKEGKYTFAMSPGDYEIIIKGSSFQTKKIIITVPEQEIMNPIITKNIIVK